MVAFTADLPPLKRDQAALRIIIPTTAESGGVPGFAPLVPLHRSLMLVAL